ncbi:MAG TPA: DUF6266 family protein [Puia sp.]|nr:DUF6266 family protein [Puia sp.]
MAIVHSLNPIQFTGRVGDLVGYCRNGKYFVRKRPRRSRKKPTPLQLEQRARFIIIVQFLKSLKPLFTAMQPRHHWILDGLNRIRTYNYRYAITGSHPQFRIDYSSVMLSLGPLPNEETVSLDSPAPGRLMLKWNTGGYLVRCSHKDRVFGVAYCPSLRRWAFSLGVNARRDGFCKIEAPEFSGKKVHAWISFVTLLGTTSDSKYVGEVVVCR